jgi:hypothetical protein
MTGRPEIKKRWSTDQLITGIEVGDWFKLLRMNGFAVSPEYLHRAAWITAWSVGAAAFGRLEDARFGRKLAAQEIDPTPLFVLGHWRSGTTHLHNLFGRLPDHTYPTVYQAVFPTSFLTTRNVLPRLTAGMLDETRTYDSVKQGWDEAAEDEIALAKLTGLSPYLSFMFLEHRSTYERYVDFLEASSEERERWKEGFRYFVKKIMIATGGKRVVIKSCPHTARIRLLLEMFPDAKFVFVHRNPYQVFASTLHMRSHTDWENFFQVPGSDWEQVRERETLHLGAHIFDRYLEDRHLIPEGNLVELAFKELIGHEEEHMERIFAQFSLPGWARARPVLRRYLDGLAGYQRNRLQINDAQRAAVYREWRHVFDAFGYPEDLPL